MTAEDGRPIADYGFISDCHSAALISGTGSIDWLCLPRFDAPSVFGRLLDPSAGHWSIRPAGEFDVRRRYLDGSLVLETQFTTQTGMAMLTDALVLGASETGHGIGQASPHTLVRILEVTEGQIAFEAEFCPRPEHGLVCPRLEVNEGVVATLGGADVLTLAGPAPTGVDEGRATWRGVLDEACSLVFVLTHTARSEGRPEIWSDRQARRRLAATVKGWQSWSALHQRYEGPARELVLQSGLVLRALSYQPTGALVAACTTSLPERSGGGRNWDQRYAWIRHASSTVGALALATCDEEADRFLSWIIGTAGEVQHGRGMQAVYGLAGEHDLSERELTHLAGWRSSRPVRVGNDAWNQEPIDLYGELLDAVLGRRDRLSPPPAAVQDFLCGLAEAAARKWNDPDPGTWEQRGELRHHVSSKLMCWVALDRAVQLAEWLGHPARAVGWAASRDEIREAIMVAGWNGAIGSFTQCFYGDTVDASLLLLASTGFLPIGDPRMAATIDRVEADLTAPCGLLYRYPPEDDGIEGDEGAMLSCTYWLVECLAARGDKPRAIELFERANAYANDLGLLSGQAEPTTGELMGNFPQALSHVGLVNAASVLARMP